MSGPENPAAFPSVCQNDPGHPASVPGMSLRDWFAGQALNGGLVRDSYPEWQIKAWFGERHGINREEIAARAAYAFADSMLAARQGSSS